MDPERKKFGRGPRELTGAVDLINHYKLLAHHKLFCKKNLPLSISDTHYLYNVVGDKEIRKGEGMELDQLFQDAPYLQEATSRIQPFELDILGQAFQLREAAPIDLPSSEKGIPTICGKSKHKSKNKERKHKKQKDKEHKKHKHRHKDNKDKKKDKIAHHNLGGDHSNKHHEKKRKYDSNAEYVDTHKQKQYRILYSIRVQRSVKLEDKSWKLRKDGTLAFFVLFVYSCHMLIMKIILLAIEPKYSQDAGFTG